MHFTHIKYRAPGITVEHAHLITSVIENIQRQSNFYALTQLSFAVKESSGLFKAYKEAGYDFGLPSKDANGCGKQNYFYHHFSGAI